MRILSISFTVLFALAGTQAFGAATQEEISTLSKRLPGGEYKGTNKNGPCTVSVQDSKGSGLAYSISVSPTAGTQNLFASFTIAPGDDGGVGLAGASVRSPNSKRSLLISEIQDGIDILVTNQIGSDRATGQCTISL